MCVESPLRFLHCSRVSLAPLDFPAQLSGDTGLEKRFQALEANTKVDDDLAALKGMIGGSSSSPPKALPSDPKVDDELQKMKDMLKDK